MKLPSKQQLTELRETFQKGMRVKLISMDDPYTKLKTGDKGTVVKVDDAGGIHIRWDNGEGLAAIWEKDVVEIIKE